jgi:hypothetical protein
MELKSTGMIGTGIEVAGIKFRLVGKSQNITVIKRV